MRDRSLQAVSAVTRCTNPKCAAARALAPKIPQWRLALCELCRRLEVEKILMQRGKGPRIHVEADCA